MAPEPFPPEELHPRMSFDLRARQQVFGPDEEIDVPAGGEAFWEWYASTVRCGRPYRLKRVSGAPDYPPPSRDCALWFSGGVESTYTLEQIRQLNPVLLNIADYPVFNSGHRRIGQIHFLCAAIAAVLGFRRTYLGIERTDLLLAHNEFSRGYLERTAEFTRRWSAYQPEHTLHTVCGDLHKEEIIQWLTERNIPITGTCDRYRGGRWCGDCYKCFEAFYTAKAVGIDLSIPLKREAFQRYYAEYRRYVDSGFADNFNNAFQHYARLQITYQVTFDPDTDCVD
jgi:hypothetical protein